ncbi:MAG TPA: PilZ domain-containing protein [Syntrophales bacterium]|nr:PilZ domain-containing protein [Syntrophales bacterium]
MFDELEKRKFQRLEFPLEVTVEIVSAQGVPKGLPQLHIKSRNISRSGICLETKSIEVDGVNLLSGLPFARENRLHLSVELIPEEPPLMATGEVQWYDIARDIPELICRLGVAFIEIKNGGKDQLARFLKKHQNNKGFLQKLLHT